MDLHTVATTDAYQLGYMEGNAAYRERLETLLQYEPSASLRGALEILDREDGA